MSGTKSGGLGPWAAAAGAAFISFYVEIGDQHCVRWTRTSIEGGGSDRTGSDGVQTVVEFFA